MPANRWSKKRERQYEHIKEGLLAKGEGEDTAQEIAARTVNKTRAQHGESKTATPSSVRDMSPGRRGGLHSHSGAAGRTYRQLYEDARRQGVEGRSKMSKADLQRALAR